MAIKRLTVNFRKFFLPKRGNSAEEYEDAWDGDPSTGRFAIADGATESSFAGLWAKLLVEGFVAARGRLSFCWVDWLPDLQKRWDAEVTGRPLPWYAEMKLDQGAFATFLGLVVEKRPWSWWWPWPLRRRRKSWRAIAVGDSCVFQVRGGQLLKPFPVERSEEFGNTPWLVGSRDSMEAALQKKATQYKGYWRAGDLLWLMTDALALWFLQRVEAEEKPWEKLEPVFSAECPDEAFKNWINEMRDAQTLKNDDVTLLVVSL